MQTYIAINLKQKYSSTQYIYTCVYSHNGIVRMVWQAVKYIYILTVSYIQSMDTIISCVDTVLDDIGLDDDTPL